MTVFPLPVLRSTDQDVASGVAGPLKASLFNHFVEKGDDVWGINFRSNALIRLNPPQYRIVQGLLNGQLLHDSAERVRALKDDLFRGRFLIPTSLDEIDLLKKRHWSSRFSQKGLTLIIAPTLRCNFACDYCYVDLNANKMTPENRIRLGKFFNRRLPEDTGARIVWTGGDPSLAMDAVEDLSARFLESCERKRCNYKASLITNGYLLNEKMRSQLRNSKITGLQISIDGSREFHDINRSLANKKPTYDVIMANVEDTCDEFPTLLRINVDKNNFAKISDLLDDIEKRGLRRRVVVNFAHVDDVNENSASHRDYCLTAQAYAEVEAQLMQSALQRGFRTNSLTSRAPKNAFCGANTVNYFVVDSSVNLLKCYHDFGKADKFGIGHIGEDGSEIVTNPYNLMKFLGWDPFSLECKDCKVLPMCMGGCSHKIMNNDMKVEHGCLKLRFTMDQIVTLVGETSLNKMTHNVASCSGCSGAESSNV